MEGGVILDCYYESEKPAMVMEKRVGVSVEEYKPAALRREIKKSFGKMGKFLYPVGYKDPASGEYREIKPGQREFKAMLLTCTEGDVVYVALGRKDVNKLSFPASPTQQTPPSSPVKGKKEGKKGTSPGGPSPLREQAEVSIAMKPIDLTDADDWSSVLTASEYEIGSFSEASDDVDYASEREREEAPLQVVWSEKVGIVEDSEDVSDEDILVVAGGRVAGSSPEERAGSSKRGRRVAKVRRGGGWRRKRWKLGPLIGVGGSGKVFQGLDSDTGELFAAKELEVSSAKLVRRVEEEVAMLARLRHRHIIAYLGTEVLPAEDKAFVFLEYAAGGSVRKLVAKYGPLRENVVRTYTKQILAGLEYLHAQDVVHRDLKGDNVLLSAAGEVKLSDFGSSVCVAGAHTLKGSDTVRLTSGVALGSTVGSPHWISPEALLGVYSAKSDIWSLGCTIIEMLTGYPPFKECTTLAALLAALMSQDAVPAMPTGVSNECRTFLTACLQRDPLRRPTATHLLRHPFVNFQLTSSYMETYSSLATSRDDSSESERSSEEEAAWAVIPVEDEPPQAFDGLPHSLLSKIFLFLSPHDLDRAGNVCAAWRRVALDVWMIRSRRRWPLSVNQTATWRRVYLSGDRVERYWKKVRVAERSLRGHRGAVTGSFFLDSNHILTASEDGVIGCWDLSRRGLTKPRRKWLEQHQCGITAMGMDARREMFASVSSDQQMTVWCKKGMKWRDIHPLVSLDVGHAGVVGDVKVMPDQRGVMTCAMDGRIKLWDVETQRCVRDLSNRNVGLFECAMLDNEVIGASMDHTLVLWDIRDAKRVGELRGHTGPVTCVHLDSQGTYMVSGGADGVVKCWDIRSRACWNSLGSESKEPSRISHLSLRGRIILCSDTRGRLRVWDPLSASNIKTIVGGSMISHFDLYRHKLVASCPDRTVRAYQFVIESDGGL